jgi:hypothetical protein
MTATGSPALWSIGDAAGGIIPSPPDAVLASLLAAWQTQPRMFGCVGAKGSAAWVVVMPSPAILCARCAFDVFGAERRCAYCHRQVRLSRADSLLFEVGDHLRVVGRAHEHCGQHARKGTRP